MADDKCTQTQGLDHPRTASTIEVVDEAMLRWVSGLNLFVQTKTGNQEVPIVWASAERSYQVKSDKDLRDNTGALILPIVSIERASIEKSLTRRIGLPNTFGDFTGNDHRNGVIQIAKEINSKKTRNYANQAGLASGIFQPISCENKKVVYDVYSIPEPVFVNINYKIVFRTEYQQQMNTIMTPFLVYPGGINELIIESNGHSFPAFVQESFGANNNLSSFTEEERRFESSMDIKVLAYLIGSGDNEPSPTPSRKETVVELHMPRERLGYGPIDEYERLYGHSAMEKFEGDCCPTTPQAFPQRFGNVSNVSQSPAANAANGQVVNINIVQVENAVDNRVGEILVFKEFMNQVAGNILGNGNVDFATTNRFKINSESLFLNGMLLHPGHDQDYIVWDGTIVGKPAFNGITLVNNLPPAMGGVGVDEDWAPPQTAEEKGHQPGEADGIVDDILLISYIKA